MYCFEKDFYEVAITSAIGVLGIASQIPCIILNGYEPINGSIMSMGLGTAFGAGISLPLRYEKWKLFHNIMKKEEFKEEKKLYLEYVKDVAEFLKSIGVSSDLSGAFLCKMLIDGGILSEDKVEYSYKEKNKEKLIKELEKQMKEYAKELDFENAALIRDEIMMLKNTK